MASAVLDLGDMWMPERVYLTQAADSLQALSMNWTTPAPVTNAQ
jgi:hypothetical protein